MRAMITSRRRPGSASRSRRHTERPEAAARPLVLMVEDDPDDRAIYGTVLTGRGFDVAFAGDYDSALRVLRRRRPDLLLLDLGLPGSKSGLDLCLDVRRTYHAADLPVVVLSGFRAKRVSSAARAAGCTSYIEKPTSPLAVAEELERLLYG